MNLSITSVHGHGNHAAEYVQLTALGNCDAAYYMVADTTYTNDGHISSKVRHTHWFAHLQLAKCDTIYLYTRRGSNSSSKRQDGTTVHHVFWGLDKAVWNNSGDGALLFQITTWKTTRVK